MATAAPPLESPGQPRPVASPAPTSSRRPELLALTGALALLVAGAAASYGSTQVLVDKAGWVQHTHQVIESLDELRGGMGDIEAMKRGYELTGNEALVSDFDSTSSQLAKAAASARRLTADNLVQQRRIESLEPLIGARIASLAQAIAYRRQAGRETPSVKADVEAGRAATQHIRSLIGEMAAAESGLLADREWSSRRVLGYSYAAQLLAFFMGVGIVLVAFRRLGHQVDLRRASEQNLDITLQSIGDAVLSTDASARVLRMNPVAERLTGWGLADAKGRPASEVFRIIHEKTREPAPSPIDQALRDGVIVALANHTALISKGGVETPIADSAGPIRNSAGEAVGAVLVFRDITTERAGAERVRQANAFLESIVENIPDMIFVKDAAALRFERFNHAGELLLGAPRETFIGKNDFDFFPAEQARHFQAKDQETLSNKLLVDIPEEPIDTPSGRRWLHTKKSPILDEEGAPKFLLGISEDITERKRLTDQLRETNEALERRVAERTADLRRQMDERERTAQALQRSEEQLRQSQKMDAVGRLAGGIAHDFNNLLSVILTYSQMLLRDLPAGSPMQADLEEILKSGERAASLTRQLLAYSRQQVVNLQPTDLNAVLANMDAMLRRLIGEDIQLEIRPATALGQANADVGWMEQILMNLVVNARDAMPTGGRLTVETADVVLDEAYAQEHPDTQAGPHVMLAVSDTGTGMDKETLSRIFEPFFTTKEVGKGTGLGLATTYGIVKQLGGSIWVYSEEGKGSTFKVYLPRADEEGPETPLAVPAVVRGNETILLVEDEGPVRVAAKRILAGAGYQVLVATDSEDALRLCKTHPGTIELLLSDVVMPGLSGPKLATQLLALRPGMKVLFMSGYTDEAVVRHGALEAGAAFTQKPLTPDGLATKVREVLAAPGDASRAERKDEPSG
jgi:two-component system cell cycle sensor histidine kinase/response regulator CckA